MVTCPAFWSSLFLRVVPDQWFSQNKELAYFWAIRKGEVNNKGNFGNILGRMAGKRVAKRLDKVIKTGLFTVLIVHIGVMCCSKCKTLIFCSSSDRNKCSTHIYTITNYLIIVTTINKNAIISTRIYAVTNYLTINSKNGLQQTNFYPYTFHITNQSTNSILEKTRFCMTSERND